MFALALLYGWSAYEDSIFDDSSCLPHTQIVDRAHHKRIVCVCDLKLLSKFILHTDDAFFYIFFSYRFISRLCIL